MRSVSSMRLPCAAIWPRDEGSCLSPVRPARLLCAPGKERSPTVIGTTHVSAGMDSSSSKSLIRFQVLRLAILWTDSKRHGKQRLSEIGEVLLLGAGLGSCRKTGG